MLAGATGAEAGTASDTETEGETGMERAGEAGSSKSRDICGAAWTSTPVVRSALSLTLKGCERSSRAFLLAGVSDMAAWEILEDKVEEVDTSDVKNDWGAGTEASAEEAEDGTEAVEEGEEENTESVEEEEDGTNTNSKRCIR